MDCDDTNPDVNPGAVEIIGNGIDEDCNGFETCYIDNDNDGYRGSYTIESFSMDCSGVGETSNLIVDCDDSNPTIYPGAIEIPNDGIDQDCDGEDLVSNTPPTAPVITISPTVPYSSNDLLCEIVSPSTDPDGDPIIYEYSWYINDVFANNSNILPSFLTSYNDTVYCNVSAFDGIDSSEITTSANVIILEDEIDIDGDGFTIADGDCDDNNPDVYPGATEICGDGIDSNCDGAGGPDYDEDNDGLTFNVESTLGTSDCDTDSDQDSLSDYEEYILLGTNPLDNDSDGDSVQDDIEIGNDVNNPLDTDSDGVINALDTDDDGDGILTIDEDANGNGDPTDDDSDGDGIPDYLDSDIYSDADNDGFPSDLDCDDTNPDVYPGATEIIGNGIDEDCNGKETCYVDADRDGYGTFATVESFTFDCSAADGTSNNYDDCDDTNPDVYPGATEICDGIDNNCDGQVDEGIEAPLSTEQDGVCFGSTQICINGVWYDDISHPEYEAVETLCDGLDNDCDGIVDEGCTDLDQDGYIAVSDGGDDCDDTNPAVYPGASEICDGVDNNCDGQVDEGCGSLVINEVDYDQPFNDDFEFIELYNSSDNVIDLTGYQIQFYNGADGTIYNSISIGAGITIPAHGYFVIGDELLIPPPDQVVYGLSIQNGPDAILLKDPTGVIIDALSYKGTFGQPWEEGIPSVGETSPEYSIGRIPDGLDTNDNSVDFILMIPTPGYQNILGP